MALTRTFARGLVNSFLLRSLPGPFVRLEGNCWWTHLPELSGVADDTSHPRRSTLALYENGVALQSVHAAYAEIVATGRGRYSHWQDGLRFATSDNTDPNSNGRSYRFSLSPWLYRRRVDRPELDPSLPVNFRKRDCSDEQLRADVEYALFVGRSYLGALRECFPSVNGLRVLEVGPGIAYGSAMVLAAYGVRPVVADRFLAPWEPEYHAKFYNRLRVELTRTDPAADGRPLQVLLSAGAYRDDVIERISCPLEAVPMPSDSVDCVVSTAVLEHVFDVKRSFAQLLRITRPGGFGLHQVDFRDHRDFNRPLEYLLLSEDEFQNLFAACHAECGNRYRASEFAGAIRAAGFEMLGLQGTAFNTPDYLADFLPRLRAVSASPYRDTAAEDLHVLSGFFKIRKPSQR
jgi:SAM-dependent methyltransferase